MKGGLRRRRLNSTVLQTLKGRFAIRWGRSTRLYRFRLLFPGPSGVSIPPPIDRGGVGHPLSSFRSVLGVPVTDDDSRPGWSRSCFRYLSVGLQWSQGAVFLVGHHRGRGRDVSVLFFPGHMRLSSLLCQGFWGCPTLQSLVSSPVETPSTEPPQGPPLVPKRHQDRTRTSLSDCACRQCARVCAFLDSCSILNTESTMQSKWGKNF